MTTPHKYADVIKAWVDNKTVQYAASSINPIWHDFPSWENTCYLRPLNLNTNLALGDGRFQWRIKPDTVKYRRYLVHGAGGVPVVCVVHQPYDNGAVERGWKDKLIRWIDDEWQEIEV